MDTESLYTLFKSQGIVTTDSRNCPPGSLFFALRGTSFDGNKFASQALSAGCSYAVVDDPSVAVDSRYLLVDDVGVGGYSCRYNGNERENDNQRIDVGLFVPSVQGIGDRRESQ